VGYELARPSVADVGANGPVTPISGSARRAISPRSSRMLNGSRGMPGTEDQRKALLGCVNCHTLERVLRTAYDAAGLLQVQQRMGPT